MSISIFRCDDRLIHGQCIVRVLNDFHIKRILLVDEFTATNPVIKSVYQMAVPPTVKVEVLRSSDSYEKIKEAINNELNNLILIKNPKVAFEIFKNVNGLKKELNIGPMSSRKGTAKATYFSNLLKEEAEAIEGLYQLGVRVYFQQVTDQKEIEWSSIRDKVLQVFK
ncbi:PTS system mannose/fructose/N-acetylgalactosamine-transporter subunit IIB [Sporanaerobacter sp. PP17-6a]|uniref:PTS system mannose/fructose/N-acetylgalactosamine-transporter subunit IIB n=1 Tax=Sporanaerobacter sp. PP17-6a TaxID=1891289 RepID=UPI0008A0928F|nr:PTS sugar transporter subunit IIB [Sporanaerobacter sp. PP17-6a]SCL87655.1 Sorbose-specific phosphotransferase enzyme IIB component [Sporanaerobacter sp. PP17-6a]